MAIARRLLARYRAVSFDIRPFSLGCLAGSLVILQSATLPSPYLMLAIWLLFLLLWLWRRQPDWVFNGLLGCLLALTVVTQLANQRLAKRLSAEQHGSVRWITGLVSSLPETSQAAHGRVVRFLFEPEDDPLQRIRVAWYQASGDVRAGTCLRLKLRLRTPRGTLNPGGMDYEGWLFREGIDATASLQAMESCDNPIRAPVPALRQYVADRLTQSLGEHAMLPFILGLTVGERSQITPEQWRVLRRTGVSHLLAISGLHIGLVAGFVFLLLRTGWASVPWLALRWPAPHAAAVTAALCACAYAMLAGFSLPTQRALVMLLLVLLGVLLGRRLQASYLLAWALLMVLFVDPFAGASAGFWLSFAAVAWIFYALRGRVQNPEKWQIWLLLQFLLACALLPLGLFWFNEGSWLSPGVNLLLIPLFSLLVPLLLLFTVLALVTTSVGDFLLLLMANTLQYVWQGLVWLEQNAGLLLSSPAPGQFAVVLALLGLLWLFAPRGWPARWLGLLLCVPLALTHVYVQQQRPAAGVFELTMLDVGQGSSLVLRTRSHLMVYDAGPAFAGGFDAGAMVLVPYLRHRGWEQVDLYVESHGDLDHRGGREAFMRELRVSEVLGVEADQPCRQGQGWRWDGVDFEMLHPASAAWQGNNASCVLRVSAGEHALLLTGDIEREAEQRLLESGIDLHADVLLAPHHGSNSSSSIGLLNTVRPQLALVSAGWRNRWNLPAERVMRRYAARDIHVLNTAETGAVRLRISAAGGVENIWQARQDMRRFWHAH